MNLFRCAFFIIWINISKTLYTHVPLFKNQCDCKGYSKNMRSIIVKDTSGNLGNKMFTYVLMYILKLKYGYDVYVSDHVYSHLNGIFENLSDIPVAETSLCGFEKFYREFKTISNTYQYSNSKFQEIEKIATEEKISREKGGEEKNDLFKKQKGTSRVSILNSNEVYEMRVNISSSSKDHSSFPWENYMEDMHQLEKKENKNGKSFILYPNGFLMSAFDDTFGEDFQYYMDDIPGLVEFTVKAFTFRKEISSFGHNILNHIAEHYKRNHPKKFRKKKDIVFVGIHQRRGDHLLYQEEGGIKTLDAGYFLEAMEMYREKFKRVVFIYVSDDLQWGKDKLEKRIKSKDFYIAGSLQDPQLAALPRLSAAVDLALLSQCNHTILSHGTYSFWAGFLAGRGNGTRILPAFFPKYRHMSQSSYHYFVPPFESKLPRFYYGINKLR